MYFMSEPLQQTDSKPKKRGARSIVEANKIRKEAGLSLLKPAEKESKAIVPRTKRAKGQEMLAKLLNLNGRRVIEKIIAKALDDDDKDQVICMKMCIDRVLPSSYFDKAKDAASRGVSITIMGVGAGVAPTVVTGDDYDQEEEEE